MLPCGPFPYGDSPLQCARLVCSRRFGMTRAHKGEQDREQRETGCLRTRHEQDHCRPGARRAHLDESLECRTHGGRITRPLRHNGVPYSGINILMLWAEAMDKGFTAPTWMTFKQSLELKANVRKGERGSLVVYASSITRTA